MENKKIRKICGKVKNLFKNGLIAEKFYPWMAKFNFEILEYGMLKFFLPKLRCEPNEIF